MSTALIDVAVSGFSHDYSYKKKDNIMDITRNLRNFRPTFELREQFLYNNQVWLSCSPVLVVSKSET